MDLERVELHLHTNFSCMMGVNKFRDYINRALELGMESIAVTDYNNLVLMDDVTDLKVIYGAEISVDGYLVLVLVNNTAGLVNLFDILSSIVDGNVGRSFFDKHRGGLLVGSVGVRGEVYNAITNNVSSDKIRDIVCYYDFLEISCLRNCIYTKSDNAFSDDFSKGREKLASINMEIVHLGDEFGKLVIASGDVYYVNEDDEICNFLSNMISDSGNISNGDDLYLKSTDEMLEEFNYLGLEKSYEVVVVNTNKISDMCDVISKSSQRVELDVGSAFNFSDLVYEEAFEKYGSDVSVYKSRIDLELEIIKENKLEGIFIGFMKVFELVNCNYIYGSGLFSSSLIGYILGISHVDVILLNISLYSFKEMAKDNKFTINCSSFYKADVDKALKEVFKNNKIYLLGNLEMLNSKTIKKAIVKGEDILEYDCLEVYDDVIERMVNISKGSRVLNNCYGISDSDDLMIVRDSVIFNSDYIDIFKIEIRCSDNICFLSELLFKTGITEVDINDIKVMELFENNICCGFDGSFVNTNGIINFDSKFVKSLLSDIYVDSFEGLIMILNLARGSDVWVDNFNLIYEKRITRDIITSKADVYNYLFKRGMSSELCCLIANAISSDDLNLYVTKMRKFNIPEWFIDFCMKIKYLVRESECIEDVIIALMLGWFKVYYPLEFYSVYFSLFGNVDDKKLFYMDRDDVLVELIFDCNNYRVDYEMMNEMYNRGIKFLNIDFEKSDGFDFKIEDNNIRIPLKYLTSK